MNNDTMPEQWKPIPGYEDIYEISNYGRVRRIKPTLAIHDERILKGFKNKQGYIKFRLCRDAVEKDAPIHRLVLMAFVSPPPFTGAECNHINGIKDDNRLVNLEWVSHGQNMKHSYDYLERRPTNNSGERNGSSTKLTTEQVLEIRRLAKLGFGATALGRQFGVSHATISEITHHKIWKHI